MGIGDFRFTLLDAEVVTIELIVGLMNKFMDSEFQFVNYLGVFYLSLRVGWYIYSKYRIIKENIKKDNEKHLPNKEV